MEPFDEPPEGEVAFLAFLFFFPMLPLHPFKDDFTALSCSTGAAYEGMMASVGSSLLPSALSPNGRAGKSFGPKHFLSSRRMDLRISRIKCQTLFLYI